MTAREQSAAAVDTAGTRSDSEGPADAPDYPGQWWLDQAGQAALRIDDAKSPDKVVITPKREVFVDGSWRTIRSRPRALHVPADMFFADMGSDVGHWRVAHAVAASRWPRRRDSIPALSLLLGFIALSLFAVAGSHTTFTFVSVLSGTICAALAVVIAVQTRRTAVMVTQTSDRQATRLAGIDAARTVLAPSGSPDVYKTLIHQWRYDNDPLRPHNRLARLERQVVEQAQN